VGEIFHVALVITTRFASGRQVHTISIQFHTAGLQTLYTLATIKASIAQLSEQKGRQLQREGHGD
jgi:hypothetical protein